MIATVFTPDGIVISTLGYDSFYHASKTENDSYIEKIDIVGHQHIVNFWNRYALVFHQVDEYTYSSGITNMLQEVKQRWTDSIPTIYELMPYIKKQIIDLDLNIIGIMAGYSVSENKMYDPYVYQILGDDIRRINTNTNGEITFNCVFIEKETMMGRIMRDVKVNNGNRWEELTPLQLRCDLFSVSKAREISFFLLQTAFQLNHINSSNIPHYDMESVVITPNELSTE